MYSRVTYNDISIKVHEKAQKVYKQKMIEIVKMALKNNLS